MKGEMFQPPTITGDPIKYQGPTVNIKTYQVPGIYLPTRVCY